LNIQNNVECITQNTQTATYNTFCNDGYRRVTYVLTMGTLQLNIFQGQGQ